MTNKVAEQEGTSKEESGGIPREALSNLAHIWNVLASSFLEAGLDYRESRQEDLARLQEFMALALQKCATELEQLADRTSDQNPAVGQSQARAGGRSGAALAADARAPLAGGGERSERGGACCVFACPLFARVGALEAEVAEQKRKQLARDAYEMKEALDLAGTSGEGRG